MAAGIVPDRTTDLRVPLRYQWRAGAGQIVAKAALLQERQAHHRKAAPLAQEQAKLSAG